VAQSGYADIFPYFWILSMTLILSDQSRQARRELGLSQSDVAEATGLKRQYLSEFESDVSNRFTAAQQRKLVAFYKSKVEEVRAAGDEIDLSFGDTEPASPVPTVDVVKAKRFHFPVDDAVSDDTLASVLAAIRTNDKQAADLLMQVVARDDGFFGSGEFTEETLQALRDSMSRLACNYLMIRAVSGWPEIGLSASNDNITGNTVLSVILGSVQEQFQAAGLFASEVKAADGVEEPVAVEDAQ
jgi:transcriptional regulator with XRE-family HTH domain